MKIYYLCIPIIVWLIVQVIKLCVDVWMNKNVTWHDFLFVAGGFPSAHSALSSSVTTVVGLVDGVESPIFLVSLVFSFLWRYDAMNVRYEAGKHASYINQISDDLYQDSAIKPYKKYEKLIERLGHKPVEVFAGVALGCFLSIGTYYFFSYFLL